MIETFLGYNHNYRINEAEFYDMKNLTSSHYPILSPRAKRGVYCSTDNPHGLIAKDALCYVDGTKFYINDLAVEGLILSDSPKQLVSMGAYIIIMPDKKYVNTANLSDFGNIEDAFPATKGQMVSASYEMCRIDGGVYTDAKKSSSPPENPSNMQLWIDTSTTPNTLKQYSETNAVWSQIATTYIKISSPNIAKPFKRYDAVKITGLPPKFTDLEGVVSPLWEVYHDEGTSDRAEGTNDYVVVIGFLDEATTEETELRLSRDMPLLDFIIESGNRLWGCRYGEDINGNIVNEIYASKLGDFKNWNCFMGLSTDSYVASCGTDGQWTGAITHLGYPLFFKENFIHKVYGNFPANFQVQSTACRGVQKGAGNSLAIVNEKLFYKSRNGVCVYDGSLPSEISSAFGSIHYSKVDSTNEDFLRNGAVGGSHDNRYYISMMSELDSKWYLFVFDTSVGVWIKQDNTRADAFCSCNGEMYYIDHDEKKIKTILGSGTKETNAVEWMAETGVIGTSMPDKKYVSRLSVRMALDVGTIVNFYIQYDSMGGWERISTMTGVTLRTFTVPIRTRRCDHFRMKIVGVGDAKIYSITKTIEQGSDF